MDYIYVTYNIIFNIVYVCTELNIFFYFHSYMLIIIVSILYSRNTQICLYFTNKCATTGFIEWTIWSTITNHELLSLFNDSPHNHLNHFTWWPIFYDVFMRIQGSISTDYPGLIWLCQLTRIPRVNEMGGSCFWNCGSDNIEADSQTVWQIAKWLTLYVLNF